MALAENKAIKQLNSLSKCCICLESCKDPRMLPCIHSACLNCFEDLQAKNNKEAGDVLPCPICRKEFTIPEEGMKVLQKNFFIENLIKVIQTLNAERKSVPCSLCKIIDEEKAANEARMTCLECRENYCSRCCKVHKSNKFTQHHAVVDLTSDITDEEIRTMFTQKNCLKHTNNPFELYCEDCKVIVCVVCFVEEHKLHECKDVTTVEKGFRRKLESSSKKMLNCIGQMETMLSKIEKKKTKLLEQTIELENAIRLKNRQLKALVDKHTEVALNELFSTKQKLLENIKTENDEIERKVAILQSFEAYCVAINSKGSPADVFGCVDSLIRRGDELEREQEEYPNLPENFAEIKFNAIGQDVLIQNISNFIGKIEESMRKLESSAIIIGGFDGNLALKDVTKVNLHQTEDVSKLQQMPTAMHLEIASAVYRNSIYITGIGNKSDEIWNFDATSDNWKKYASMVKGRRRHSVAFIHQFLYICGGYVDSNNSVLDDVEAYDAINRRCSSVGKLVHPVQNSGNCISFKSSLYVFGGSNANDEAMSQVQVYDTKLNTCTLLIHSMPVASSLMRAALFGKTVILLGRNNCVLYDFDKRTWQERHQFRTEVDHFGMIIENDQIFVLGGVMDTTDAGAKSKQTRRDEVRCIPLKNFMEDKAIEWKHHAKLSRCSSVYACDKVYFWL